MSKRAHDDAPEPSPELPLDCWQYVARWLATPRSLDAMLRLGACCHAFAVLPALVAPHCAEALRELTVDLRLGDDAVYTYFRHDDEKRGQAPQRLRADPGTHFMAALASAWPMPVEATLRAMRILSAVHARDALFAHGRPTPLWGHETRLCELFYIDDAGDARPLHRHPDVAVVGDAVPSDMQSAHDVLASCGAFQSLFYERLLDKRRHGAPHRLRALVRTIMLTETTAPKPWPSPDGDAPMERVAIGGRCIYAIDAAFRRLPQPLLAHTGQCAPDTKARAVAYFHDSARHDAAIVRQIELFGATPGLVRDDDKMSRFGRLFYASY